MSGWNIGAELDCCPGCACGLLCTWRSAWGVGAIVVGLTHGTCAADDADAEALAIWMLVAGASWLLLDAALVLAYVLEKERWTWSLATAVLALAAELGLFVSGWTLYADLGAADHCGRAEQALSLPFLVASTVCVAGHAAFVGCLCFAYTVLSFSR